MSVRTYPTCPRCKKPVRKADEHELRLQLVNAHEGAPKHAVDLHDIFHHVCAGAVWRAARSAWFEQAAADRSSEAMTPTGERGD